MADGKGTITGMIRGAESTPKAYTNHANHPGHTTVTFNKQKSPLNSTTRQGSDSTQGQARSTSQPTPPKGDPLNSTTRQGSDPTQGTTRQGSTPNTDPEFLKDPLTKLWN